MGLAELLGESMGTKEDHKDRDLDHVLAALNRFKIEGLKFGDKIKGKKLGEDYRTISNGDPVIFVRYLTDAEKVARNGTNGSKINNYDAVISFYIDKRDGEVCLFMVDTSEYERVEGATE